MDQDVYLYEVSEVFGKVASVIHYVAKKNGVTYKKSLTYAEADAVKQAEFLLEIEKSLKRSVFIEMNLLSKNKCVRMGVHQRDRLFLIRFLVKN